MCPKQGFENSTSRTMAALMSLTLLTTFCSSVWCRSQVTPPPLLTSKSDWLSSERTGSEICVLKPHALGAMSLGEELSSNQPMTELLIPTGRGVGEYKIVSGQIILPISWWYVALPSRVDICCSRHTTLPQKFLQIEYAPPSRGHKFCYRHHTLCSNGRLVVQQWLVLISFQQVQRPNSLIGYVSLNAPAC